MDLIATEHGEMKILYEDDDVIAFVKPVGLLSQNAESGDEKSALGYIDEYLGTRGATHPVHRLDRTTGGVMIAAKTSRSAAALSRLVESQGMKKEYLAVVHGRATGGILDDMLYFDRRRNKSFVVKRGSDRRGVKRALLEYEAISGATCAAGDVTLVRVRLMTGRTHQIRVQMSNASHALLGDGKYGGRDNKCTSALWSERLCFDLSAPGGEYFASRPFGGALAENGSLLSASPSGYPWDLFE